MILNMLYLVTIRPLTILFEFLFSLSYKITPNPIFALTVTSIAINILVLPLYNRADELQKQSSELESNVSPMAAHIKKYFHGDEKVMILSTYYNQMHYSPLNTLKSSISLLLQVPFFIAAYSMISNLTLLNRVSAGPISDLSSPDGILKLGSIQVNILPFIMTIINIISCMILLKGKPVKEKVQLFLTALVFLILLYNSPSALVYYWTCNNVFSLVKSLITRLIPNKPIKAKDDIVERKYTVTFLSYSLICSIFIGLLIPSDLLSGSAGDFLFNYRTISLSHYLIESLLISIGFFSFWGGIFFFILKHRKIVTGVMISIAFIAFINYYFYQFESGNLDRFLHYSSYARIGFKDGLINVIVCMLVTVLVFILLRNRPTLIRNLSFPILISVIAIAAIYTVQTVKTNQEYGFVENQRDYPELILYEDRPNVIVIMLDRAVGRLTPSILSEMPELQAKFDGFTYYENSLSFGQHTNMASPALYGGYEYTPAALNERSNMQLVDKHNEALQVMPVLFGENNYSVTVCDPSYAGYMDIPDLSIYDNYPYVNSFITEEITNPYYDQMIDEWTANMDRNLFSYSLRLASPMLLRDLLYDNGFYNDLNRATAPVTFVQNIHDMSHATGLSSDFIDPYYALCSLPNITTVTSGDDHAGSFTIFVNNTTHETTLLEEPDYLLSHSVDNANYDKSNNSRFFIDGNHIEICYPDEMGQYQSQVAAYMALASWFDYLRELGVYDNSRIIIVSDHGTSHYLFGITHTSDGHLINICNFNCLFMVKDFGATGFTTSDTFVTNAETPVYATNGLIENPVNPFTGNQITSDLNNSDAFLYFESDAFYVTENNANQFLPGMWYTFDSSSGDIRDDSAWTYQGIH